MKRSTILIAILLCSVFSSSAQEIDKLPVITVSGTAEVQIAPDEAVFSIDVTKTNKDLQAAKRLNDESVGKILELTRRFSISPQNVQTTQIAVDMKYESIRDAKTRIYSDDGDEIVRPGHRVEVVHVRRRAHLRQRLLHVLRLSRRGLDEHVRLHPSRACLGHR